MGDQREPEESGSHRIVATTPDLKRNPEVGRHDGSTQPIHIMLGERGMSFYKLLCQADGF
jgi:hypothetical protein